MMSAALSTVVALLVSSFVRGVPVPVTTTASRFNGSDASVKSRVARWPAATATVRVWLRYPMIRTRSAREPTGTSSITYAPFAPLTAPLPVWSIVSWAPATAAPRSSLTLPASVPVACAPNGAPGTNRPDNASAAMTAELRHQLRILNMGNPPWVVNLAARRLAWLRSGRSSRGGVSPGSGRPDRRAHGWLRGGFPWSCYEGLQHSTRSSTLNQGTRSFSAAPAQRLPPEPRAGSHRLTELTSTRQDHNETLAKPGASPFHPGGAQCTVFT